jgi:hypothetical protein
VTKTRLDNFAGKQAEKSALDRMELSDRDVVWVGPSAPPLPPEEIQEAHRIAGISDPNISSGERLRFFATLEKDSEILGNSFCLTTLNLLYLDGLSADWVQGRPRTPLLEWRQRLSLLSIF